MTPRPDETTPAPNKIEELRHIAGNRSLWNISKKYFTVIAGAIFGLVLAKPEIAKTIHVLGSSLDVIIQYYILAGAVGLFFGEIKTVLRDIPGMAPTSLPTSPAEAKVEAIVQKLFVGYTLAGVAIFHQLFSALTR